MRQRFGRAEHDPRTVFTDRPIVQFMLCAHHTHPSDCGRSSRRRFLPRESHPGCRWRHTHLHHGRTFQRTRFRVITVHIPGIVRIIRNQLSVRAGTPGTGPARPPSALHHPQTPTRECSCGTRYLRSDPAGQRKSFAVPDKSGPEHRSAIYATFPDNYCHTHTGCPQPWLQRALRVWFFAQHTARDEIRARTIRSDPHHALNFRGAPTWSDRAKPAPAKSRPFPIPHIRAPLQDSRPWPGRD